MGYTYLDCPFQGAHIFSEHYMIPLLDGDFSLELETDRIWEMTLTFDMESIGSDARKRFNVNWTHGWPLYFTFRAMCDQWSGCAEIERIDILYFGNVDKKSESKDNRKIRMLIQMRGLSVLHNRKLKEEEGAIH